MVLTRADKWLIAILLVVAVGGIGLSMAAFSAAGEQEAQVYKEGKLIQTIKLRPGYRQELRVGGAERYNIVMADNGRIRITEADCPDQICVVTGWVSVQPQQVVCLPWRVVIKIVSSRQVDIDDITR